MLFQELAVAAKAGAGKWSLEDDDDEDVGDKEGNGESGGVEESEEEDPLDAYMKEVSKEVKKIRGPAAPSKPPQSGGATGDEKAGDFYSTQSMRVRDPAPYIS